MTIYKVAITVNVSAQGLGRATLDDRCLVKKMWVASMSTIVSRQAVMPPHTLRYLNFSVFQKFYTSELLCLINENIVLRSIHII